MRHDHQRMQVLKNRGFAYPFVYKVKTALHIIIAILHAIGFDLMFHYSTILPKIKNLNCIHEQHICQVC